MKNALVFVLIIIIAAAATIGGFYWLQSDPPTSSQDVESVQVNSNAQADRLEQDQNAELPQTNSNAPAEASTDKRTLLLLPANQEFYGQGCDEKFNADKPQTTITYSDSTKGISLEIPYNQKWGSDTYKINPYDSNQTGTALLFGAVAPFEACAWVRAYHLRFLAQQSADEVVQRISQAQDLFLFYQPEKISLGSVTAVKYGTSGLCSYPTLEIIGEKYNYKLQPLCDDSFEAIEAIAKTIKLIN